MRMKKGEVGYCLLHNCHLNREKIFNKCTARKDGKCRYLLILNKKVGENK